jgi:hypothetical protein
LYNIVNLIHLQYAQIVGGISSVLNLNARACNALGTILSGSPFTIEHIVNFWFPISSNNGNEAHRMEYDAECDELAQTLLAFKDDRTIA